MEYMEYIDCVTDVMSAVGGMGAAFGLFCLPSYVSEICALRRMEVERSPLLTDATDITRYPRYNQSGSEITLRGKRISDRIAIITVTSLMMNLGAYLLRNPNKSFDMAIDLITMLGMESFFMCIAYIVEIKRERDWIKSFKWFPMEESKVKNLVIKLLICVVFTIMIAALCFCLAS